MKAVWFISRHMKFRHTEFIWDLQRLVWEPSLSLPVPLCKVMRDCCTWSIDISVSWGSDKPHSFGLTMEFVSRVLKTLLSHHELFCCSHQTLCMLQFPSWWCDMALLWLVAVVAAEQQLPGSGQRKHQLCAGSLWCSTWWHKLWWHKPRELPGRKRTELCFRCQEQDGWTGRSAFHRHSDLLCLSLSSCQGEPGPQGFPGDQGLPGIPVRTEECF